MAGGQSTKHRVRDVHIPKEIPIFETRNGVQYVSSGIPLGKYPVKITEKLEYWAQHAPDRVFFARREGGTGEWNKITYAQALTRVRNLAQGLIDRKLGQDRPVAIISGNSMEHLLLAHACMYAGVMYAPVAPAYSLQAKDYSTLKFILDVFEPGLVFASEGAQFERALSAVLPQNIELVTHVSAPTALKSTSLAELESKPATSAVDEAHARINADTVAKILFTSGSTGHPKGVKTTQRMLCANQEQIRTVLAFMADEPPVFCDWLPWNHVFGGSHNVGLILYNGGTFYMDDGRPTPQFVDITARNLREIATTAYFNVPRGYEMLLPYLRSDRELRETFFSRVNILFYAAAGMGQHIWDELQRLAVETVGEEILMITGLGATETAPFALSTGKDGAASGMLGLPVPGVELKLAQVGEKIEARVKGPNVTPGFWKRDDLTRSVFDEDGYYCMGDALRWADPMHPEAGFLFDGRISEDFKMSSGTWVSVGPLRARFLNHFGRYAVDVVIGGHDRSFVGALVFPNVAYCREQCPDLPVAASASQVLNHPRVHGEFERLLKSFVKESTGASTRIDRAIILEEPPSIDAREITDKGSINQRNVLANRFALVEDLYADTPSERVLIAV
jgi:feruloyl-CoA synthase